jgi:hypothetical protein
MDTLLNGCLNLANMTHAPKPTLPKPAAAFFNWSGDFALTYTDKRVATPTQRCPAYSRFTRMLARDQKMTELLNAISSSIKRYTALAVYCFTNLFTFTSCLNVSLLISI